jgi:hypothetical protein
MFCNENLSERQRFLNVMEYKPVDRIPNHEAGVWVQTMERWKNEGLDIDKLHWDWFSGEEYYGMNKREFIRVDFGMQPAFEYKILEETDRYEIIQHTNGVVTKALKAGTSGGMRSCMDQYLSFPVTDRASFRELKKRFIAGTEERYPKNWKTELLPRWKNRDDVLVLGQNCSTLGFFWRAREWMGTENVCYGWYDEPELMHEMMEYIADFTMENSKPILAETDVDYIFINEDMSMKNGPLLSPQQYREFIFPHMKKLVDFYKKNGARYVLVDTDGNCEALIPLLMEAGVDGIWPLERVAGMDPVRIRKEYGKELRLWGGVDKMELAKGREAIDKHLAEMVPLIEEGGFIPTVDHCVSPDVSLENFEYYMKRKNDLLSGKF